MERHQIYQIASAIALLVAIALLSSGPVSDGDYWWQIAYGQYMVENGTLIPNHSIYSWSSTNNAWIYCAWLAEITLHYAHQTFGVYGGSLFRYLSMVAPALVLLCLSRFRNIQLDYSTWFYLFVCYSISRHAGGLMKPELFSHLLFAVVVGIYFAIKSDHSKSTKLIYALPAVLLLWINTHAGFIVGMFFVGIVLLGELINHVCKAENRLSSEQWTVVWLCAPLCLAVLLCTPYGYVYPVQLFSEFFAGDHASAYQNVTAYNSIYSDTFDHLGVKYYAALAVLLMLPLLVEASIRKRTDYALIFANLVIFLLSASWGRFSYFSPVLMFFTFAYLLNHSEWWSRYKQKNRAYGLGALACVVIILGVSINTYRTNSFADPRGPAFGLGYLNPVSETEYVRTHLDGMNLCNGYNGGGYLLWALGPTNRIMIDPRYFPYAEWYQTWLDLASSSSPTEHFDNFECDAWVINHTYDTIIRGLVDSKDWGLAYLGSAAVVFVRKNVDEPQGSFVIGEEVAVMRSLPREAHILNLLLKIKEYDLAMQLTAQARKYWTSTKNEPRAVRLDDFISATISFLSADDKRAYALFKTANQSPGVLNNKKRERLSGQYLTETLWRESRYAEAYEVAKEVLMLSQGDIISIYNTGFLGLIEESKLQGSDPARRSEWRSRLQLFIKMSEDRPDIPPKYIEHASSMLETRVPVNAPPLIPTARPKFTQSNLGAWQFQD